MKRHFRHLRRIVDDLLDVTRLTTGNIQLQRETVNLSEVLAQAIDDCQIALEKHVVGVDVASGVAPLVSGDPVRLLQALSTLVDNAAKHTEAGGRIDLSVRSDAEAVVVRVVDTGRGVPSEMLPTIFEPFVPARARSDGSGGLGLGLALVKRLVELHDGTVAATSAGPGRGSAFEVTLPRLDPG